MGLWQTLNRWNAATIRVEFQKRKFFVKDIWTENIFMKYNEQIKATTKQTNPPTCHQNYVNDAKWPGWKYLWIEFTDLIVYLMALFSVELMISIKIFKVVANVGNQPLFSCLTVGQNTPPWSVFFEERSMIFLFNGPLWTSRYLLPRSTKDRTTIPQPLYSWKNLFHLIPLDFVIDQEYLST